MQVSKESLITADIIIKIKLNLIYTHNKYDSFPQPPFYSYFCSKKFNYGIIYYNIRFTGTGLRWNRHKDLGEKRREIRGNLCKSKSLFK